MMNMNSRAMQYALGFASGAIALYGYNLLGKSHKPHDIPVPGAPLGAKTLALDKGAAAMQYFGPLNNIHNHVCGFHCYSGALDKQVRAHHFCSHLNEDVIQCVIYDSDAIDAKLIGVEYIISERLFKGLPAEEKELWHSHIYEVKGGVITAPSLPQMAEKELMKTLANTYGKTFHMWQVDRGDPLPFGIPQLMMSFTRDNQIRSDLLRQRDSQYNVSTQELVNARKDIAVKDKDPRADAWERSGSSVQLERVNVPMRK